MSAEMRVCFYTATFLPTMGGAEVVLDRLAGSLTERGHRVVVLAPRVRGRDNRLARPYRVIRYQRPTSKRFGVRQILLHLFYIKAVHGFDLLHCHGAYPPGFVGASFKSLTGTPLVIRPHGSDILPGEGIRNHPRLDRRVQWALGKADAIVAQSRSLEAVIEACGVRRERLVRIPNGIPLPKTDAVSFPAPDAPYVFAMGSLTEKKGFDVLIEAFARVAPRVPDAGLWIAGDGPERARCEALARSLGLGGRVRLLGRVEGEAKERLLAGCLFFVTPSRREPFANVNLEAMAAGKAIVATAVGGNPEVVRPGENGVLVEPLDPQALADGMTTLLEKPDLARTMGEASRRIVREYDWEGTVDRYLALYESVLGACP